MNTEIDQDYKERVFQDHLKLKNGLTPEACLLCQIEQRNNPITQICDSHIIPESLWKLYGDTKIYVPEKGYVTTKSVTKKMLCVLKSNKTGDSCEKKFGKAETELTNLIKKFLDGEVELSYDYHLFYSIISIAWRELLSENYLSHTNVVIFDFNGIPSEPLYSTTSPNELGDLITFPWVLEYQMRDFLLGHSIPPLKIFVSRANPCDTTDSYVNFFIQKGLYAQLFDFKDDSQQISGVVVSIFSLHFLVMMGDDFEKIDKGLLGEFTEIFCEDGTLSLHESTTPLGELFQKIAASRSERAIIGFAQSNPLTKPIGDLSNVESILSNAPVINCISETRNKHGIRWTQNNINTPPFDIPLGQLHSTNQWMQKQEEWPTVTILDESIEAYVLISKWIFITAKDPINYCFMQVYNVVYDKHFILGCYKFGKLECQPLGDSFKYYPKESFEELFSSSSEEQSNNYDHLNNIEFFESENDILVVDARKKK